MKRPMIIRRGTMAETIRIEAKADAIPISSERMPWNISTVIVDQPGVCRTIVELNSEMVVTHVRMAPAMIPPAINRMVILKNVFMGFTPNEILASSIEGSSWYKMDELERAINGIFRIM